MSTAKITGLVGVNIDGTSKLTDNKLKTSAGNDITFPSSGGTLATTSDIPSLTSYATKTGSETLTNKTLTTPIMASIKPTSSYTLTLPQRTDTLATLAGNETLTNKTLTTPTIQKIKNTYDALITIPTGTGNKTLATLTGTETLTNKTLTTPIISQIKPTSSYTLTLPQKTGTLATLDDGGLGTLTTLTLESTNFTSSNTCFMATVPAISEGGATYYVITISCCYTKLISALPAGNCCLLFYAPKPAGYSGAVSFPACVNGSTLIRITTTSRSSTECSFELRNTSDASIAASSYVSFSFSYIV